MYHRIDVASIKPETGCPIVALTIWEGEKALPKEYRAMDQHFGDSTWIRLGRPGFDALDRLRRARGLVNWDQVVEALCAEAAAQGPVGSP